MGKLTKILSLALGLSMMVGIGTMVGVSNKDAQKVDASTADSDSLTYSDLGIANSTSVAGTAYDVGDFFQVTVTKESAATNPTYYTSGTAVRCYVTKSTSTGNKITITRTAKGVTNSAYITSVTYSGTHNKAGITSFTYSAANGSGTSITASSSTTTSATYTEANAVVTASAQLNETGGSKNGQFYLTGITVGYAYTAPTNPLLSLDKTELTVGLEQTATFTVTTANLTNTFTVTSGDTDKVTVSSISPAASSSDGDYVVTLYGKALTNTSVTVTIASTGATSVTLTVDVEELPIIDENFGLLSWDSTSYANGTHILTMSSTYTWGFSTGQKDSSNVAYLGTNNNTPSGASHANSAFTLVDGDYWTMSGSDYSKLASAMNTEDYWSTYGSAIRMLNFGVIHPTSFKITATNVGNASDKYYIFASTDSGDSWTYLAGDTNVAADTAMSWSGSTYSSTSSPVQFAFVVTGSSIGKTISGLAVEVYGDSLATTKVLDSISISSGYVSSYTVGESFDVGTATVTAHYTDSTTYPDEDVTSSVSWTDIVHGTTSVTGTYNGKTVTVNVTVSDEGSVFKKVTSTNELIAGAKVIIGTSTGTYTAGAQTSNNRHPEAAGGSYGSYTDGDIENYSVNTAIFTIGITENGYTFYDGDGYLYAASSSQNYLRTEATLDENMNGEWSITITNGVATIVSQGTNTHNTINGNGTAFGAYEEPTVTISLYSDVKNTIHDGFGETYMHMSDYTTSSGYCKDEDHHYYVTAKAALLAMGADYISELQTNSAHSAILARYNAWADACGDTTPFEGEGIVTSGANILGSKFFSDSNTAVVVIIVSMVGITAIGGYFVLKKSKEN